MNRATFNKAVVPGLFAFIIGAYKRKAAESDWRAICSVRPSKKAFEEAAYGAGLGLFAHKPEGTPITYDDMVQGPTKKWVHKTYALGAKITEELIDDSLYPDIPTDMRSLTQELGASGEETKAVLVWDMINNGTATTNHTCADGVALFSTAHTYITGGSWSNQLSPSADLSATALQTAIDNFETIKSEEGRYQVIRASKLIVAPQNAWKAKELLNSTFDPESANNSVNTIKERNLKLVVSPYITDTDSFILMSEPPNEVCGIIVFERKKMTYAQDGDFETGDAKFKGSFRFSVECCVPNNLYYSAGI
ncbi:MAG TPA: Mu-like prophage major head subunit gpT family protein [Candidatus Omnitrophota bacterium]|nr:Mu-like prophage major head subunit gpT family protein [Candidatus Omnitrophota bacterium]